MTDDWDHREVPELLREFKQRGITLRAVGDELEVTAANGVRPADRETLRVRRWDLIRHLRNENVRGLRYSEDGKRYRWRWRDPGVSARRQTTAILD